ncbi:porin, partial [Kaarinaea lacus]
SVNGMVGPVGLWLAYETWDYAGDRDSDTGIRFGASWKVAAFKINFLYQTTADQRITAGGVNGTYDRDVMSIGGAWKMGKSTFKLQYAMADDISCGNGVNCDNLKTAASTMGIGWDYSLSKATTFYVMYAMTANDDNAAYTVTGGGGHGDNLGATETNGVAEDNSAFSVGYIVKF